MRKSTFEIISPVDNSIYVSRAFASDQLIENTLRKAEKARAEWLKTPIDERAEICQKAVKYFIDHADAIGEEISWQMGRPLRYTPGEIKRGFKERAEHMIQIAGEILQDRQVSNLDGFRRFIRRKPLGLIMVLAPWNYPYLTSVNVVIPALMAGNVVLLKHAQQTPLCAERYASAFEEAGLPEGIFQYLHLDHQQVSGVISDRRVSHVAFTGSLAGGRAIKEGIGQRFITSGLELGGKDPAYVLADANLQMTIENLVDGSFFNSGQSCCGIERIYVDEKIFDDFVDGFTGLTKKYLLDNPTLPETTLGPMVRTSAADAALLQIEQAVAGGAKKLIDPKDFPRHQVGTPYLAPQVLIDVNHTMQIMQEESFAPVVGIMPVKNDQQAIDLMNDSRYGLTASLWTRDAEHALRIGDQIETGTCYMNRCDYLDPELAWTGVKDSGYGTTLSHLGYQHLTRPKSFHLRLV